MKNKTVIIAFILTLIAAATILWMPADEESVASENRAIATMPPHDVHSLMDGTFTNNFENYLGDNLGYRSFFTYMSGKISARKGFTSDLGKLVTVNKDVGTGTTQKASLLIAEERVMEVFNDNGTEAYSDMLDYFGEHVDKRINLYSMVVPTQLEFKDPVYANVQDSQRNAISRIYNNMPKRIVGVDVYDTLKEHINEYIYFRTDHHWTARGAFYAYTKLLEVLKENDPDHAEQYKPVTIEEFPEHKVERFFGNISKQANSPELYPEADTVEWFDINERGHISVMNESIENGALYTYETPMFAKEQKSYRLFLAGDNPFTVLTNNFNPDGRTIVIVRDSYCNAFAPWLINNYKRVILVDPRSYEGNMRDILDKYKPDDMLVMNYIFTTTFADYCEEAINLFSEQRKQ